MLSAFAATIILTTPSELAARLSQCEISGEATHSQSAADYVTIGRDVESQVLARAIHAHIHHRVFINGNRTVIFAPLSYSLAYRKSPQSATDEPS